MVDFKCDLKFSCFILVEMVCVWDLVTGNFLFFNP